MGAGHGWLCFGVLALLTDPALVLRPGEYKALRESLGANDLGGYEIGLMRHIGPDS